MRNFLTVPLLALATAAAAQQDIQFSQYVFNGLSLNPAYAGYRGAPTLNAAFRDQWAGFPGAPKTAVLSLDGLTDPGTGKTGLGIQFLYDQLGPQQNYSLTGFYAYRIALNDDEDDPHKLCFGIGAVASQYSLNGTVLQYSDPNDPSFPQVDVRTKIVPDANFGVFYYSNDFYAGGSLMNLFSLNNTRTVYYADGAAYTSLLETTNLYLTAGGMVNIADGVKMKPSFLLKDDFKGPANLDINDLFLLDEKLWVGGSYRSAVKMLSSSKALTGLSASDAAALMVEFFATPDFRIGYAYDFTTSGLSNYQTGSHELSLTVTFSHKKDMHMSCPTYF
ncbi:PorP/SprF family type IX secretion system membrane protein [Dinghuibacter silviterrae]|uniref:Type IX secretion system PorP/SprF family membrane protein n=1 Tax=Dinghuibacter silviterrae TaxID=1539049 RepID=A0A4R8DUZ5_9BACT|nr:type IX secretion system membrane protein PorP/SprF [Dinghuibacter silviterrae]TDX01796.1 type IX secretion system PorP/SprF family membrane protein [Dinghuibacter silviterrae]